MRIRIGLDIGATKTKILIITPEGKILAVDKIKTDSDGTAEPIVARASEAIERLVAAQGMSMADVEAVAVGIAGFSNPRTGLIDVSPNLHWYNVPFKQMLTDCIGKKVYMANDVNAAAWGEFTSGAGRGAQDIVAVFVGSGIGGGIVCNGLLLEGATGTAGEVGHMTYKTNGLKCDCGRRGCFEAYAGGMPLERRLRELTAKGKSPGLKKLVGGEIGKINTKTIRLAAEAGDPVAAKAWAEVEDALVTLCANLISLLNPDRLVIGGGVIEGNPGLLKLIKEQVPLRSVALSARQVKIVKSELGDDAVAVGAAALADLYRREDPNA